MKDVVVLCLKLLPGDEVCWGTSSSHLLRASFCSTARSAKTKLERATWGFKVFVSAGKDNAAVCLMPPWLSVLARMKRGCLGRGETESNHLLLTIYPVFLHGAASTEPYLKQEKMPMARNRAARDVE